MQNKRSRAILVILLVILLGAILVVKARKPEQVNEEGMEEISKKGGESYLIEGFPKSVPIYQSEKISSSKYFVNDDRSSSYLYGGPVNYYNVVYKTSATRDELFEYYRQLMDEVETEQGSESKLVGRIGDYRVQISKYTEEAGDAYLQVILPSENFEKNNPYFADYPKLVLIDPEWMEKESSYGLLNQKGGEREYTQYFVVDEDKLAEEIDNNPYDYYYLNYYERSKDKEGFEADEGEGMISYMQDGYEVTITFSKEHARIYLMIRGALETGN